MKLTKILAVFLVLTTVLFAQSGRNSDSNLAFSDGSNHFSTGFLAGWGSGEGLGLPIIYDRGIAGGMFSVGGELRLWWAKYQRGAWGQYFWHPHHNYWYNDYGRWWVAHGMDPVLGGYNVWRQWYGGQLYEYREYGGGYRVYNGPTPPYVTNPQDYNWDPNKKLTKFGWSPTFRFMFHPFGMPALRGQVRIADVFDPYVGLKFGFSVINWSKDDLWKQGDHRRDVHFPVWNTVLGLRWFFNDNVAILCEASLYDFTLGINFKF